MTVRFVNLGNGQFWNLNHVQRVVANKDGTCSVYLMSYVPAEESCVRVPAERAWAVLDAVQSLAVPSDRDFQEAPTR